MCRCSVEPHSAGIRGLDTGSSAFVMPSMAARAASTSSEGRNGASVSMKAARRCTVACRTRNSPCGSSKRPLPTYSHGDYARGSGNRPMR